MVLGEKFATNVMNTIQLRFEKRVILVLRFGNIKVSKGTLKPYVWFGYYISFNIIVINNVVFNLT